MKNFFCNFSVVNFFFCIGDKLINIELRLLIHWYFEHLKFVLILLSDEELLFNFEDVFGCVVFCANIR